jgi:hypothetical protein
MIIDYLLLITCSGEREMKDEGGLTMDEGGQTMDEEGQTMDEGGQRTEDKQHGISLPHGWRAGTVFFCHREHRDHREN